MCCYKREEKHYVILEKKTISGPLYYCAQFPVVIRMQITFGNIVFSSNVNLRFISKRPKMHEKTETWRNSRRRCLFSLFCSELRVT